MDWPLIRHVTPVLPALIAGECLVLRLQYSYMALGTVGKKYAWSYWADRSRERAPAVSQARGIKPGTPGGNRTIGLPQIGRISDKDR